MADVHDQRILIIDFGSQYSQLIARRIREIGVYCEIQPFDVSDAYVREFAPRGIILSGGPESVVASQTPRAPNCIFELGCPVLGICYGMQAIAVHFGGEVEMAAEREFGHASLTLHAHSQLFAEIEDSISNDGKAQIAVWMSHGDRVINLPKDFISIAESAHAPIAAMADLTRQIYGVQFHPEVTHTRQGQRILQRFTHDICGCRSVWTPGNIIEAAIEDIRHRVGSDHVILGLSGGVDSSVAAVLLQQAIGKQLHCVFVDNGLLRLNEAEQVVQMFGQHFGIDLIHVDAAADFYAALKGVEDPEAKRKVIGKVFIDVFANQAKKLTSAKWLAQGTIYPDVIESAATKYGKAQVIKSHHNVGGLPDDMPFELLEPLRELFKDEVRKIGLELGLPYESVYRHPFPGPGLGVRILGEVSQASADLLRQADHIFIEELQANGLYYETSQAFAVFLPVNSVGVMGDARRYEPVIALRAVETIDFMTANYAPLPHEFLAKVANRIINEVNGISRVVYDISSKPPATIEWE